MIDKSSLCQILEWDSQFFRRRIARVTTSRLDMEAAEAIEAWCKQEDIECLYFLADADHAETVKIAEDFSYRFMDIRMMLNRDMSAYPLTQLESQLDISDAQENDINALLQMSEGTFLDSRFYYDKHFKIEDVNRLYKTWIQRSVLEDFADEVFVIRKNSEAIAYISCKLNAETKIGNIGLVGVAESARGQNLAAYLLKAAFDYFRENGMQSVEVVTQGRNIAAQRLYQKAGFRTAKIQLWYHKWFKLERN